MSLDNLDSKFCLSDFEKFDNTPPLLDHTTMLDSESALQQLQLEMINFQSDPS